MEEEEKGRRFHQGPPETHNSSHARFLLLLAAGDAMEVCIIPNSLPTFLINDFPSSSSIIPHSF